MAIMHDSGPQGHAKAAPFRPNPVMPATQATRHKVMGLRRICTSQSRMFRWYHTSSLEQKKRREILSRFSRRIDANINSLSSPEHSSNAQPGTLNP